MAGIKHVELALKDKLNLCVERFTEFAGKRPVRLWLKIIFLVTGADEARKDPLSKHAPQTYHSQCSIEKLMPGHIATAKKVLTPTSFLFIYRRLVALFHMLP